MICDFAETYHIYDIYQYPAEYIATLAAGLRGDSRIRLKISGMKVDTKTLLMAKIADNTALNVYAKTKDAEHGRNYPKSLVKALTEFEDEMKKPKEFETGEDFMKAWSKIVNGNR